MKIYQLHRLILEGLRCWKLHYRVGLNELAQSYVALIIKIQIDKYFTQIF